MRPTTVLIPMLLVSLFAGCSSSRIERYFPQERAPKTASADGAELTLLYFKQSMRHFYGTIRITNRGSTALTFTRVGDGTGDAILSIGNQTYIADEPTHTTWTPWTGTVERTPDQIGRFTLPPGASTELSLRWAFPISQPSYEFDWTIRLTGLKRDQVVVPDLLLPSPGPG
jgi:hypothetical protein